MSPQAWSTFESVTTNIRAPSAEASAASLSRPARHPCPPMIVERRSVDTSCTPQVLGHSGPVARTTSATSPAISSAVRAPTGTIQSAAPLVARASGGQQTAERDAVLSERPGVSSRPLPGSIGVDIEEDHSAALLQHPCRSRVLKSAATESEDQPFTSGPIQLRPREELLQHFDLPLAKCRLAMEREELGYGHPRAACDLIVEIEEAPAEQPSA